MEFWFYICYQPMGKFPNRFIDFAGVKSRLVPWVGFQSGATGYLHWGLNFWSKDFKEMGFGPGDTWVLYPGKAGPRSEPARGRSGSAAADAKSQTRSGKDPLHSWGSPKVVIGLPIRFATDTKRSLIQCCIPG